MDKREAKAYARIALLNLIENKIEVSPDALLYEMNELFDIYSEEAIKKEALFRL